MSLICLNYNERYKVDQQSVGDVVHGKYTCPLFMHQVILSTTVCHSQYGLPLRAYYCIKISNEINIYSTFLKYVLNFSKKCHHIIIFLEPYVPLRGLPVHF